MCATTESIKETEDKRWKERVLVRRKNPHESTSETEVECTLIVTDGWRMKDWYTLCFKWRCVWSFYWLVGWPLLLSVQIWNRFVWSSLLQCVFLVFLVIIIIVVIIIICMARCYSTTLSFVWKLHVMQKEMISK